MSERILRECPIKCGRRHYEPHPHLEAQENDVRETIRESTPSISIAYESAPVSVTGADSPETLASQAQAAIASETKKKPLVKTREEKEREERATRIIAMRPLARKLSTMPYTTIAIATFDERWMRIRESELAALEQATLNTMLAWGIEFTGKWSSVSALILCHGEIIALKLKEIYVEEQEKKARDAVTQKQTSDEKIQ